MTNRGAREGKPTRRRTAAPTAADVDPTVAIAPLRVRWAANSALRPVSAATMRGIRAKAARLGLSAEEISKTAGAAIADVARAVAATRDPKRQLPIFILAGSDRDAVYGLEAARALSDGE
ncbi:MAG: hypothetical protein ACKN9G_05200, partial [Candidatus Limnocylindrus sp.]